jgi:hypothetical protein
MKFSEIEQFTDCGGYLINVSWRDLGDIINRYTYRYGLEMNPDFQRGHVWTTEQQVAYVEFGLRGGRSGLDIFFNCPGWIMGHRRNFVLVDGLQRITAVLRFLRNEIPAFGHRLGDYQDRMRSFKPQFNFYINELGHRHEVLRWYIEMNSGGIVHSDEELSRVRNLYREALNLDNNHE